MECCPKPWIDKKERDGHEKEKGTGSEAKKMGNESMGENEEICLFENICVYPMTYSFLKKLFLGA